MASASNSGGSQNQIQPVVTGTNTYITPTLFMSYAVGGDVLLCSKPFNVEIKQ
jgi:hypothetical protein